MTSISSSPAAATPAAPVRRLSFKLRALNQVGDALKKVGIRPINFRKEGLLKDAAKQTGLKDFGDPVFHDPLTRLGTSIDKEANLKLLNTIGHRIGFLVSLKKRLYIQQDLNRFPEISQVPVTAPLFILGMPRSGTTLLHNLLSMDDDARWLHPWEDEEPWPERPSPEAPDPRESKFRATLEARRAMNPKLAMMHDFDSPGECDKLFSPTFFSHSHAVALNIPTYAQWLEEASWQEWLPPYRYYRQQLQRLSWYRPGGTWVLRSPQHMGVLETLLEVFPDARCIHLHRDPKRSIPSASSFVVTQVQRERQADPQKLGELIAGRLARRLDRTIASRKTLPANHFFDIHYPDLLADPIATIRRVYDYFGLEMTATSEHRMRGWLLDNPQHKRGVHKYTLEQFGLTAEKIDRLYGDYREYFGVQTE